MAEAFNAWQVDLGDRVKDLPVVQTGIKLPTPILVRAEQLCDVLDHAGEHRPDRQFLLAALLCTTEPDPEDLAARLRAYRLALVHEVVIGQEKTTGKVELQKK